MSKKYHELWRVNEQLSSIGNVAELSQEYQEYRVIFKSFFKLWLE